MSAPAGLALKRMHAKDIAIADAEKKAIAANVPAPEARGRVRAVEESENTSRARFVVALTDIVFLL